jgi:hypothetical protein
MPAELPIACSLKATELPARLAEITTLGDDALIDVHRPPGHAELRSRRATVSATASKRSSTPKLIAARS